MPLWTFFGLRKGKATTAWPRRGTDGRPGRRARHAALRPGTAARPAAPTAPRSARPRRSRRSADGARRGSQSTTAAASSASSASRPARPGRSALVRLGLRRAPARGPRLVRARAPAAARPRRTGQRVFRRSLHIRHVDAGSCNGCESELQALNNPFYNLHRLGIFFTPSPRFADLLLVTGPVTYAMHEPAARDLRGDAGAALGDGGRHLRGLRRHRRRRLCLRQRPRRRAAGRSLSARLPAQSGGDHRGAADVPRPRAATSEGRPPCRMTSWPSRRSRGSPAALLALTGRGLAWSRARLLGLGGAGRHRCRASLALPDGTPPFTLPLGMAGERCAFPMCAGGAVAARLRPARRRSPARWRRRAGASGGGGWMFGAAAEPDRRARRLRPAGRRRLPCRLGDHEPRRRRDDPGRASWRRRPAVRCCSCWACWRPAPSR